MRRIVSVVAVAIAALTASAVAIAQITSGVPTPQPRSGVQPNVLAPSWTASTVAQGSNSLENPAGIYARYGYISDASSVASGLDTKSEPDENTYLHTATNPGGPTAGFDYGRHFLIQGHEVFGNNTLFKAYLTRVNLDIPVGNPHRITLLNKPGAPFPANPDGTAGTGLQSIDGSVWDPFNSQVLFTAEAGNHGGVIGLPLTWTSTTAPDYVTYDGSFGQAGFEGIHPDNLGNLILLEDTGGSGVTDGTAVTKVKQPNSFAFRFKPTTPGDLTHGVLQALQVTVDGTPVTFHTGSATAIRNDALGSQIQRLHSGGVFAAQWINIHDTAVSTAPFDANAAAKAAGATPLKRPENGQFVPGTGFKSFVFDETGDTDTVAGNYVSPVDGAKAADRGSWGAILRIDMPAAGSDTAAVKTIVNGDADHASFDNLAFLDKNTMLVAEDRGDTLHKELGFVDSLWSFDLGQPLATITEQSKRLMAQGRDADSFADVSKKEATPPIADQNDGDNEVTGVHVSDGSTSIAGIVGTQDPATLPGERIFFTNQHGSNVTSELTPPAIATRVFANPAIASLGPGLRIYLYLSARLVRAGGPVGGEPITFKVHGTTVCTATTDAAGNAACGGSLGGLLTTILGLGYDASFGGDGALQPSSGHGPLVSLLGIRLF